MKKLWHGFESCCNEKNPAVSYEVAGFWGNIMSFIQKYDSLLEKVRAAVKDALENEVAGEVKDIMQDQTDLQVYSYDASPMAMATRRVDDGGLGDKRNMVADVVRLGSVPVGGRSSEYELTVENVAPFQSPTGGSKALSDVVEEGLKEYRQPCPRPFVSGTEKQAVNTGAAYRALKEGLKRHGF